MALIYGPDLYFCCSLSLIPLVGSINGLMTPGSLCRFSIHHQSSWHLLDVNRLQTASQVSAHPMTRHGHRQLFLLDWRLGVVKPSSWPLQLICHQIQPHLTWSLLSCQHPSSSYWHPLPKQLLRSDQKTTTVPLTGAGAVKKRNWEECAMLPAQLKFCWIALWMRWN